ncbi:hypothetical protein [Geofilum rubicundum]|uniref:asparagine synthase (glutamine-hydrolyzing) n=1 Tax=Geofilum rubicundum JCM 15548 TaxID=1236989 RepID=A0A0E9LZR0_9BACT|nr:hypothetical protein [Geofilum rubicundum]GAO30611.1 asparagine synthetase [Geofilum rubicundum JCM 15548]
MSIFILDVIKYPGRDNRQPYTLTYSTSTKFGNDKINYENIDYILVLDGIVLNKKLLFNEGSGEAWSNYVISLYDKYGSCFFSKLKGSYYGCLFDKKKQKWIVFSDHIGSKPIYYFENQIFFCFSNNYMELLKYIKEKSVSIGLNEKAAYLVLTYGFVFEDLTICKEVKRLMIGHFATIKDNSLSLTAFYKLGLNPIEISEEEAVDQIDIRFRAAVSLAFEKDKEYGYKHLAALSGGLDSRMTVWVAHDLGYTNQLNITFSQSNYLDETVAKQISSDLEHEWLFKSLDNGMYLKNLDETTEVTGGNALYSGLAHALSLYKYINFTDFGLLHSGQLGDVVLGSFSNIKAHKHYKFGDGGYSQKLVPVLKNFTFKDFYPDKENFKLYIRGFNGANQGLLAALEYTETWSPFYDIDFMEFALSIPIKLRSKHHIYKKWINTKYPKAAKYIWEKEKVPVNYSLMVSFGGKHVPLSQLYTKLLSKIGINTYGSNTKKDMNPLGYWIHNNEQLNSFLENYFRDHIVLLNNFPKLKGDCERLYFDGTGTEKAQVLTLLSALNVFKKSGS